MAGVALGRDDTPVGRLVVAVVAAEAAREILMAEEVRMRSPRNLHVGPDVSPVDLLNLAHCGLDGGAPGLVNVRILRPVELRQARVQACECFLTGRIRDLEQLE